MEKKTLRDVELRNRRVLIRVDFNVPLDGQGRVADDTRIRAALPTLRYVFERGCPAVLMSHMGRPKGRVHSELSLRPAAERLGKLLGRPVAFAPDCVGPEVEALAGSLNGGEALVLENLRFHPEEEGKPDLPKDATEADAAAAKQAMKSKQASFAEALAGLGEVYVNDAFGTAHRAHASMVAVARRFEERVAGFLLESEIVHLGQVLTDPPRPFVLVLGGAKISGKINVLRNLVERVDTVLVGGAMVYTFFLAKGLPVGRSMVEPDQVHLAAEILGRVADKGVNLVLPVDHVVADAFAATAHRKTVGEDGIEAGWMALDIGPETVKAFEKEIAAAKTVLWNGPMGCFEMEPFAEGTMAVARAVARADCVSVIGGGDSVSAVNRSGVADKMTHISTGGGASLEFLEGRELPGIAVLQDR